MRNAYLQFGTGRGPYQTVQADAVKETETPRSPYGMGYGFKIPTRYMLKHLNRWRRVYVAQFGNGGTCWVNVNGERVVISIDY